jgi:hypothetical protein
MLLKQTATTTTTKDAIHNSARLGSWKKRKEWLTFHKQIWLNSNQQWKTITGCILKTLLEDHMLTNITANLSPKCVLFQ